jgi:glycosyltransferase involved in cell wall biosynthesis
VKRALLLYSSYHFDPRIGHQTNESASIIAKSLYKSLEFSGYQVDYIGPDEADSFLERDYDLFVGQPANWLKARIRSRAKKSVLFMPTTHPLRRNNLMKQVAKKWNVSPEELLPVGASDLEAFQEADWIIQIGNQYAIEGLLRNGVPINKIIHVHYGLERPIKFNSRKIINLNSFLYLATTLGLRKGFPELIKLFSNIGNQNSLMLIGRVVNEPWITILKNSLESHANWLHFQFIESYPEYLEIISKNAFLIFPTVEEAEPGTLIESMSLGLVPLITSSGSGIDYSICDNCDREVSIEEQINLIKKIDLKEFDILSKKAVHYIDLFHDYDAWEKRLNNIWNKIYNTSQRFPHVSIILPIYNKEKTISTLIKNLWTATKTYRNFDLHVIYDGCVDQTEEIASKVFKNLSISIFEYKKDDIFEVKSNNFGLRKSKGEYCVLLQDDNYIYENQWLEQMISWLDQHPKVAVLGGLAGVNFFPLGTKIEGVGVSSTKKEVYQRLDWRIDSKLNRCIYETDAVMRGPLILRKSFLEKYGYLDEIYAPLYNDDMDYCFRMRDLGFGVFCFPISVENRSLTMAKYDSRKNEIFSNIIERNSKIFYNRWEDKMGNHDSYLTLPKPRWGMYYDSRTGLSRIKDKFIYHYNYLRMDKSRIKNP